MSFTIDKKDLTITADSDSKVYDGTALTKNSYTHTSLADGDEFVSVTVNGSQTSANSSDNVPSGAVIRNGSDIDVTGSYNITYLNGTLEVTKRPVTLTSATDSKEFDGNPLTNNTVTVSGDGWATGEGATFNVTGTITKVGTDNNTFTYALNDGILASNYTITPVNGKLTIMQNTSEITVVPGSGSKTYDGTALTKTEQADFAVTGVPDGFTWTASADGTVTNVVPDQGEKAVNAVSEFKILLSNEDVTDQFSGIDATATGTLSITPKAVTVTAEDKDFTYNGTSQSWAKYVVYGLVGSDEIDAVVDGSIQFPSESPRINELVSYRFTYGKPGNYSVTTVNGILTLTKASQAITITAASDSWTYDGSAHTNTAVNVTSGNLFTGDVLEASATGSVTNVSETSNGNNPIASGYKVTHGNRDVTENYSITPVAGTLTIIPRTTNNGWMTLSEGGSYTDVAIDGDKLEDCTYDFGDGLTATNVTFSRKFTTEYATICLPFEVDITTANNNVGTFYQIVKISENVVEVAEVIEDLAANTPYIVKPNDYTGSVAATLSSENISFPLTAANDIEDTDGKWTFKGAKAVTSFTDLTDGHVVYFFASTDQKDDEDNIEIYAGDFVQIDNANAKAAPFRAYLDYTGEGNLDIKSFAPGRNALAAANNLPKSMSVIIVNGDGTTTKIGTISVSGEDTWFTIDGIQLEGQPTEGGLYIRNGRAVMVK